MRKISAFLIGQILLFAFAALTHFGIVMSSHQHRVAGIAEAIIGTVLVAGLLLTLIRPTATRAIAITVQCFALLGTGVGIYTIIIGIGPRSMLDAVFHICMAIALVAGLIVTGKSSAPAISSHPAS